MTKFAKFFDSNPVVPRLALGLFLVCFTIGIAIGITTIAKDATDKLTATKTELTNLASSWQVKLTTRVAAGNSLASTAGAFALGEASGPVDLNGTLAQRSIFLNATRWTTLAATLFSSVPGMLSLQVQPGGVITMGYPNGSAPIGLDNWNRPTVRPAMLYMIQLGNTYVQGPYLLAQGGWGYVSRFPVFLNPDKQVDSFWGVCASVFRITNILASFNASAEFQAAGYDWLVYGIDNTNSSKAPNWIDGSSGLDNATFLQSALLSPCPSLDPYNTLWIAIAPKGGLPSASPPVAMILIVVFASLGGSLLVAGLMVLIVYAQWSAADANRNAPTTAPLCLMFTDIESSTDMWRANPKCMGEATDLHHAVVRRAIEEFGAYEVKTIGDSFMIGAKDSVDGIMLALQIQKALNDAPWPAELSYSLINREKPLAEKHVWKGLRVRIGLHHATDVEPKFDQLKRYWDYYGNDVNCCARVESMAEGGQILVTAETLAILRASPDFDDMVEPECAIALCKKGATLKGIDRPFDLYSLTPNSLTARTFAVAETTTTEVEPLTKGGGDAESQSITHGTHDVGRNETLTVLKMIMQKLKPSDKESMLKALKTACDVDAANQNRALYLISGHLAGPTHVGGPAKILSA